MILPILEAAIAAAMAMTPREFEATKQRAHPAIVARLHGDGRGRLIALRRDYKPIGWNESIADYADSRFDHLRVNDTAEVRGLAVSVNPRGRTNFPGGVTVPILAVIAPDDSRRSYCARLRTLMEVVR